MKNMAPARLAGQGAHGVQFDLDGGQLSVEAVEPSIFRVRFKPESGYREPRTWAITPAAENGARNDVPWHGRPRDDTAGFTLPALDIDSGDGDVTLRTDSLQVKVLTRTLTLQWQDTQHRAIAADRATSAYFTSKRTGALRHYLHRDRGDRYYGLGDKTGPLDLHGRRLRTFALDSLGYDPRHGDPLYKHWPFVLTRAASGAWYGIYYDTLAACTFDFGCEHDNYHELFRYVEIDDGDLDYYFISGRDPAEVIARYVKLIGGTHLPPRWSLGFAQTAMGLADADDAQTQLSAFIDRAVAEAVPLSSFHYGSGYSSRGKRRYVFTWNTSKFPDPKALNAKFKAAGMRLVANLKPCLLDDHPAYEEVKKLGGFIHDSKSGEPVMEQFWDGIGAHLDFSSTEAVAWWQKGLEQQVLDYGIDVGWNDNNEYAIMADGAACKGFGQPLPMHRARPLHPLLMTRATFEAQARHAPGEAVYTVTRGGSPGLQRYAQTWTGDNTTSWETLKWNIRTGLQMSLSGLFNIGHDVGGFAGPVPDPELFLRWVQACCLNPRMVMNSWKAGNVSNVPWMHASVKADVIAAIKLRYRLMPYLWSLFERAQAQHQPIIRPTFYAFPDDEACYADCDDFMLGDALLVAPVVEQGALTRRVYLPAGPETWIGFRSGERFAPGQWHTVAAPLSALPIFVRSGASIPLAERTQGVARHDDPVTTTRRFA
jgi:alpha-glucosidase